MCGSRTAFACAMVLMVTGCGGSGGGGGDSRVADAVTLEVTAPDEVSSADSDAVHSGDVDVVAHEELPGIEVGDVSPDQAACGDGICADGETCTGCPADCGECPLGTCGLLLHCSMHCGGESACLEVCRTNASEATYGLFDAVFDCLETACGPAGHPSCMIQTVQTACPLELGVCLDFGSACLDGFCSGEENCDSCTADCGACKRATCLDIGDCVFECAFSPECLAGCTEESAEEAKALFEALRSCLEAECPTYEKDCVKLALESACAEQKSACEEDPAPCGDWLCSVGESCEDCSNDCGPCLVCGDGECVQDHEDCFSCPTDCGECAPDSCEGQCGGGPAANGCECHANCPIVGTCCDDFYELCFPMPIVGSCVGWCGTLSPDDCYCDVWCEEGIDCCPDYQDVCP